MINIYHEHGRYMVRVDHGGRIEWLDLNFEQFEELGDQIQKVRLLKKLSPKTEQPPEKIT